MPLWWLWQGITLAALWASAPRAGLWRYAYLQCGNHLVRDIHPEI